MNTIKFQQVILSGMLLLLAISLCGCPPKDKQGKLIGWISDTEGAALPFVEVAANGVTTHTDGGGLFSFDPINTKENIPVTFALAGYAPNAQVIQVSPGTTATMSVTLKRLDAAKALANAANGGAVENEGNAITLPPNALKSADQKAITGTVDIHITALNMGDEVASFPGGGTGSLDLYAAANFEITQNGETLQLNADASVTITIKLPAGTPLEAGDTVPLWHFDVASGTWVQVGTGTVVEEEGALYIEATVSYLGWWSVAITIPNPHVIKGHVYDANGQPAAQALIFAVGQDYHAVTLGVSDDDGAYSVWVKPNAQVRLELVLPGAYYVCAWKNVASGAPGETTANQDLTASFDSCIQGRVTEDDATTPIADTRVYSSTGGSDVTDDNGEYCIPAPGSTYVAVYVLGRPAVVALTPDTANCATGNGAEADITIDYPDDGDRLGFVFGTLRTTDRPLLDPRKDMTSMALFYSGFKGDAFDPFDADAPLDTCRVYTASYQTGGTQPGSWTDDTAVNTLFDLNFNINTMFKLQDGEAPAFDKIGALDAGSPGALTNDTVSVAMKRPLDYYFDFTGNGSLQNLGYNALEAWMGGFFFQEGIIASGFNNGDTVTYSWPGGLDIGPFTASGVLPGRLTLSSPTSLATIFDEDTLQNGLTITWDTDGQGTYLTLMLETLVIEMTTTPVRVGAIVCKVADDGSYTIPPEMLAQLPRSSVLITVQANYLFAKRQAISTAEAPLTRGNGAGYVVLNLATEPVMKWSLDAQLHAGN